MTHKITYSRVVCGYLVSEVRKDGKDTFIQTDYDYPALARDFGWNMQGRGKCRHNGTDGTVDCPLEMPRRTFRAVTALESDPGLRRRWRRVRARMPV